MTTRFNRREFIGGALGALSLAALPAVSACQGVVRGDFPDQPAENGGTPPLEAVHRDILRLASLAPSGHNAQPWTVRIEAPGRWVIGSEPARWLTATDPENRELTLAIGAFLRNLSAAASSHGIRVSTDVIGTTPNDSALIRLGLSPGSTGADMRARIENRRTVRTGLRAGALSQADHEWLASQLPGHAHYFPPYSREAKYLVEAAIESNRSQVARDAAMIELGKWIRWADRDGARERNGLTPEGMDLSGIPGWYVRHFFDRESTMTDSFRKQGLERATEQARFGGGWLVLTSTEASVSALIETGFALEGLWLELRGRGIALHPMSQIFEETPWGNQIAGELRLPGIPQFVLRAAYVDRYPDPVSLRMPLSRFVSA